MNSRALARRRIMTMVAAAVCLLVGCSAPNDSPADSPGVGQLVLSADVHGTAIDSMVVTATAADLHSTMMFPLARRGGQVSGVLAIPSGSGRVIAVNAIDSTGVTGLRGGVTLNVVPGKNPAVQVPLTSQGGKVSIVATLGPVALAVVPSANASPLHPGQTFALQAHITAPNGDVIVGPPVWATSNPSIVTVGANGVATAVGVGTADIVATYEGVAAMATLTITP